MLLLQSRKSIAPLRGALHNGISAAHPLPRRPVSALSTVSKRHRVRFTVHFNTDISRTLLDLIANYDTSLLVSDVRTNCAASNEARIDDGRARFVPERIALFRKIIFVSLS